MRDIWFKLREFNVKSEVIVEDEAELPDDVLAIGGIF